MKVSRSARITAVACVLMLASCAEQGASTVNVSDDGATSIGLTAPLMLQTRAVVANNLEPRVRIDGASLVMNRSGSVWRGDGTVNQGSNPVIEVEWVEKDVRVDTAEVSGTLLLAKYTRTIQSINQNESLSITSADYITDGAAEFDIDGDGISNLQERNDNTDAFDIESPAALSAQVNLNNNSPDMQPIIDGRYDAAFWPKAQFLDQQGSLLRINNLMRDNGAIQQVNDQPNYQWGALHDGQYLYLFVFGEASPEQTPFGDSTLYFQDDSLEIFWDGNHSKGSFYDNVDDIHIVIPLIKQTTGSGPAVENKSGDADTRLERGANTREDIFDLDAVTFATCLCPGERSTWEIRIDLEAAKIPVGTAFGFEVQINDDYDGGSRDVKWGWFHPSRGEFDTDTTWEVPSVMGDVRLKPFPIIQ